MRDILDIDGAPDEALGRVFVDTTQTKAVFRRLDALFERKRTTGHAWGVAVLGPARSGKTSVVREYLLRCRDGDVQDRMDDGDTDVVRRPLRHLYIELKPQTRLTTIASQTLAAMGDPDPTYGDKEEQADRVHEALRSGTYEAIIYDEIHNLVDTDTLRVEQKAAHWLSGVLDVGVCPMIMIGYTGFKDVLIRNEYLAGRLLPVRPLTASTWDDPESLAEFAHVLSAMEGQLGLPQPSGLSEPDLARRICYATSGRFGFLENLLTHARDLARENRHSCITRRVLAEAVADTCYTWRDQTFNPIDVDDLAAEATRAEQLSKRPEAGDVIPTSGANRGRRKL